MKNTTPKLMLTNPSPNDPWATQVWAALVHLDVRFSQQHPEGGVRRHRRWSGQWKWKRENVQVTHIGIKPSALVFLPYFNQPSYLGYHQRRRSERSRGAQQQSEQGGGKPAPSGRTPPSPGLSACRQVSTLLAEQLIHPLPALLSLLDSANLPFLFCFATLSCIWSESIYFMYSRLAIIKFWGGVQN